MDCRSRSRNMGLMCFPKLTGSPGPGKLTSSWPSAPAWAGSSDGGPAGPQSQRGGDASPAAREVHSR
jgi:hypothetical protein